VSESEMNMKILYLAGAQDMSLLDTHSPILDVRL